MRFLNSKNKFTLISSNAPVENYPEWDNSNTYNTGDKVIHNNKIWESAVDNNNTEPTEDNINWVFISWTNPYRCVDEYINTQTENDSDIVMEFNITKVNGIALFNVEASSIIIEVYDAYGNLILTKEQSAVIGVSNWKDYFFEELEKVDRFFFPLAFIFQGKIKLTIKKAEKARVGMIIIGYLQDLGLTLQGINAGIDDYSKKQVDKNGNIYLTKGNYRDTLDCKVFLYNIDFSTAKHRLVRLRGEPVLWVATEKDIYRELLVYGYYENFSFAINNNITNELRLTLRGLV